MNMIPTLCLAAVLAGPLHAQSTPGSAITPSAGAATTGAVRPAVTAPSGAMSGMDGSNGVDTIQEAHPPTAQEGRETQYRLALAQCNGGASTKMVACKRSAKAVRDQGI